MASIFRCHRHGLLSRKLSSCTALLELEIPAGSTLRGSPVTGPFAADLTATTEIPAIPAS